MPDEYRTEIQDKGVIVTTIVVAGVMVTQWKPVGDPRRSIPLGVGEQSAFPFPGRVEHEMVGDDPEQIGAQHNRIVQELRRGERLIYAS